MLNSDRFFDPEPNQKKVAIELYLLIEKLLIISPHSHVDPSLFREPDRRFGNPVELLIQPDHYLLRVLYSQGMWRKLAGWFIGSWLNKR